jgi:hypothetical protein
LNGEPILKLLQPLNRVGNVKFWAHPRFSWVTDLDGNAVALIAVDGLGGCAGNVVHMDEAGTVLPGRRSLRSWKRQRTSSERAAPHSLMKREMQLAAT